jgi:predicted DCC family thiol-disulfide oxidoreductase YuxK
MATQSHNTESHSGRVEQQVAATLADIDQVSPLHDALCELCLSLARSLDLRAHSHTGQDGMATAALARELRSTLELVVKGEGDGDSDAINKLLAHLGAPVSTEVRDPKD